MKILFGIVIGASLMFGGIAFAAEIEHGIVNVNEVKWFVPDRGPTKYYDYDNGVVCYAISNAISCLHN